MVSYQKKFFHKKKDCWRSLEYSVGGITGDFANHERSQKQQKKPNVSKSFLNFLSSFFSKALEMSQNYSQVWYKE